MAALRAAAAQVWRDIARFQSPRRAYCFEPVPAIRQWFASLPLVDDNELFALSLAIEPRAALAASDSRPRTSSFSRLFGAGGQNNSK